MSADPSSENTMPDAVPASMRLPGEASPPSARPKRARSGKMKGRHFGPRPVADPLDAWLPPTRCTAAQRAAFEAAAEAAGLSLNAYQRQKLCGEPGPRARRARGPDAAALARILAALGRSGNNLNQLLRRVNAYDFRGHPELIDMQAAMTAAHAAHRELCEAILAELGV